MTPWLRAITPYGLGVMPLLRGIQAKSIPATTLEACLSPSQQGIGKQPIHFSALGSSLPSRLPNRIQAILDQILSPVIQSWPVKGLITRVFWVLPHHTSPRASHLSASVIKTYCRAQGLNLPDTAFQWSHEADPELWQKWLLSQEDLRQGKIEALLCGGVDSFFSLGAIRAMEKNTSLRKKGEPDSLLLGEGGVAMGLFREHIETWHLRFIPEKLQPRTHEHDLKPAIWISDRSSHREALSRWYDRHRDNPVFLKTPEWAMRTWLGYTGAAQAMLQLALAFQAQCLSLYENAAVLLYGEQQDGLLVIEPD